MSSRPPRQTPNRIGVRTKKGAPSRRARNAHTRSKSSARKKQMPTLSRTNRTKKRKTYRKRERLEGVVLFVVRNRIMLIAGVVFLIFAAVALVIILSQSTNGDAEVPKEEQVVIDSGELKDVPDNYDQVDDQDIDDETLAGLSGEGLDDTVDDVALDSKDQNVIGIIKGSITSEQDKFILQKIEDAALAAKEAGEIDGVKFYNSNGNQNQQIQDIRNLINAGAKAVIIDVSDATTFTMMTGMAKKANVPVVAINAPVQEGYDLNILLSNAEYGKKTGEFITSNMPAGTYIQHIDQQDAVEAIRWANIEKVIKLSKSGENSGQMPDVIITKDGEGLKELKSLVEGQSLPKIFVGDATVGFIKYAYALKNEGIEVKPKPTTTPRPTKTPKSTPKPSVTPEATPTPAPLIFRAATAQFIAEASPQGIGGLAFEFAKRLGQGKKPKPEFFTDKTYTYSTGLFIDANNLSALYNEYKDKPDTYRINVWPTGSEVDNMFS